MFIVNSFFKQSLTKSVCIFFIKEWPPLLCSFSGESRLKRRLCVAESCRFETQTGDCNRLAGVRRLSKRDKQIPLHRDPGPETTITALPPRCCVPACWSVVGAAGCRWYTRIRQRASYLRGLHYWTTVVLSRFMYFTFLTFLRKIHHLIYLYGDLFIILGLHFKNKAGNIVRFCTANFECYVTS